MLDLDKVSSVCMLAHLHITNNQAIGRKSLPRLITKVKKDEGFTDEADLNMLTRLYPKLTVAVISTAKGALLKYHRQMTLPWGDGRGAPRLLLVSMAEKYLVTIQKLKDLLAEEVRDFAANEQQYRELGIKASNGHLTENDYPDDPYNLFVIKNRLSTLPANVQDLRLNIPAIDKQRIAEEQRQEMEESLKNGISEPITEMLTLLGRLVEVLSRDGRVESRTFDNVQKLLDKIENFNLLNDETVNKQVSAIKNVFSRLNIEYIKENKEDTAEMIADVLESYF
jgi:hypothetical protein